MATQKKAPLTEKQQAALDKVQKRMHDEFRLDSWTRRYRDIEYFHAPEYPHSHEHTRLEYRAARVHALSGRIGWDIFDKEQTPWGQQRIKLVLRLYREYDKLIHQARDLEKTCPLCAKERARGRARGATLLVGKIPLNS